MNKYIYTFALTLITIASHGQTQIYGGNLFQTFNSGGTTTGPSSNANFRLYSVVGQPIAVNSNVITQTQSGILSAVTNGVLVVDNTPPTLANTTATSFVDGDELTVTIDDGTGIGVDPGKDSVYYKPITSAAPSSKSFSKAKLTLKSGNIFSATIAPAFHDEIGIEFFFVGRDLKGNKVESTEHYFTYLKSTSKSIPISKVGSTLADYRLFSIPYDLQAPNNGYNSIFNGAIDGDHINGRLYGFNVNSQTIESTPTTLSRGLGYWVLLKEDPKAALANVVAPTHTRTNLFTVTLPANKWILLGNPYPVAIKWSDIMTLNGLTASSVSKLYKYNGTAASPWDNPDDLQPFEAAYIQNLTGTDINLKVGFTGQTATGGRRQALEMPTSTDINSEAWVVPITARQNGSTAIGGFGMHPEAQTKRDWYDDYAPPAPFEATHFKFTKSGFALTTDVVKTTATSNWDFSVASPATDEVELSWPSLASSSGKLFLYDQSKPLLIDMIDMNSYSFKPSEATSFSIFFGENKDAVQPNAFAIGLPYPNPVRQQSTIHFQVALPETASDYQLVVQLFTSNGQSLPSRHIVTNAGVKDIEYELDPQVTPGMYFYRISAAGSTSVKSGFGKLIIQN